MASRPIWAPATRAACHNTSCSELVRSAVLAVEELRTAGVPATSLNELNEVGYALDRAGVALDNLVVDIAQEHGTRRDPELQP